MNIRAFSVLAFAFLSVPTIALSQERVSLASLINEATAANPGIRAAAQRYDAAGQRAAQARGLPDPMVSAGYTSVGSPLPGDGLRTEPLANLAVMVSQTFPFPGKRDLRTASATREADAEQPLIDMARLSVTSRVKQAYYRLAKTYATSDVLERNVALLDTLLQVSEGRYAVGQAAQQDVIKAQTELSILELQQRRLAQEKITIEAELNALRNRPASTPIGRPDDLALVTFDHPLDALIAAARDEAPMLRRDRLMIERAEAGVELARKESRPDLTVSGGYAYSGVMPPMFEVRVDVNVPLRKERRTAAVAEQTAQAGASRADYDATRLMIETSLQQQYRASATALELARLYRDAVLPQARLALESSLASYESGSVDFLSVLTNFSSVLEYELNYFEELTNFHVATSQVEEMTGTPLVH